MRLKAVLLITALIGSFAAFAEENPKYNEAGICMSAAMSAVEGVRRASEAGEVSRATQWVSTVPFLTEQGLQAFEVGYGFPKNKTISVRYIVKVILTGGRCDIRSVEKEIDGVG